MAAKVVVLYNPATDAKAFEDYYYSTHVPLAWKLPGRRSYTTNTGPVMGRDGKPAPYQLVAELTFDSMADLQAGMGSPEGQAAAADVPNFATAGASVLVYDTRDA